MEHNHANKASIPRGKTEGMQSNLHVTGSPGWMGYLATLLMEAALTSLLRVIQPHFPIANFPIPYVLLIMAVAYMFGEGPAILAFFVGLAAFTYFFVYPLHVFWPPAATPEGWARLTAFLLGTLVVGFATIMIRRSAHRAQRFASVLQESNTLLQGEISERKRIEDELINSESRYRSLFSGMSEGFALHEVICGADGKPYDYRFLEVNQAFERLTDLKREDVVGKTVMQVMPETEAYWIEAYGKVALTGTPAQFENYTRGIGKHFEAIAYSPAKGQFATLFIDITEQVAMRQQLESERNLLQTMMESTNSSLVYLDSEFNFIMVNSAYARGSGHTAEELIGRNLFDLLPNAENEEIFKRVRDTGVPAKFVARPFEFADQPWRGITYWDWTLTPLKDIIERVQGLMFSLVDVTERIRAKKMSEALNDINAAVNSTPDFDVMMQRVVVEACKAMGTETAAIALHENGFWVPRYVHGFPESAIGIGFSDDEVPFAVTAAQTGKPVTINDAFADERVNPDVRKAYDARSILVVPLMVMEQTLGAFFFNHHLNPVHFSESQIDFAAKLGSALSLAIENAHLFTDLQTELAERKRTENELEALVKLLRMANEQQEFDVLMQTVVDNLKLSSGCEAIGIRLKSGNDFPYYATSGLSEEFVEKEKHLCSPTQSGESALDEDGKPVLECMCGNVICGRSDPSKPYFTERGTFWTNDIKELVASLSEDDPLMRNLRGTCVEEFESVTLIPLRTGGETYGMIHIMDKRKGRFDQPLISLLEEAGNILANVVARKQAKTELGEARDTAEHQLHILQKALIPSKPTVGVGYNIASTYIPAFTEQAIGGDFFDVFATQNGKVGILIGDVSGKGIKAAAMAAAARSTVRAFAYESSTADEALTHANVVLCSQSDSDSMSFITMFLAILDPTTGDLLYSSAGHPPAGIYRADGSTEFLGQSDLPVGIMENVHYCKMQANLGFGDKIVLYTDGVSEARHSGMLFGTEGIEKVLKEHGHEPAAELMANLLSAAIDWGLGRLTDDTAIIIIDREASHQD